jgi:hypothetical protein
MLNQIPTDFGIPAESQFQGFGIRPLSRHVPIPGRPSSERPRQADAGAVRSNLSTGSNTSRQDSHCCFEECGRSKSRKGAIMTDAERREKARLRSERWRRAHGIGPRRPAQRPWLAEGVSRSTWYRRKQRARDAAAAACTRATFERAEAFAAVLTRDLARCAALECETMAILAELAALTAGGISQAMV